MAMRRRIRRRVRRAKPVLRRTPASGAVAARAEAKQRLSADSGLLIGGVHDPAEKAADRMADRVMRMPADAPVSHRKCDECEAEEKTARRNAADEEETVKRSPAAPLAASVACAPASPSAARAIGGLGSGRPLPKLDRAFFEPRFGADLSGIRLHDGPEADKAARAIDARAFTLGSDVVFARNQRQAGNPRGDRLLAHELAHVMGDGQVPARRTLRRATLQKTDHPTDSDFLKVPDKDEPRIKAALKIINRVSRDKKCAAYFKDKCSGGAPDELSKAVSDAKVYKVPESGLKFGSSLTRTKADDPRTIGYTDYVFRVGRWSLAATLLHEMFHTCILGTIPKEEVVAETGIQTCRFYTPWVHTVTPKSGKVGDRIAVIAHRIGAARDAQHKLFLGGVEVTSIDKWEWQGSGHRVEFKVPAGAKTGVLFFKNHDISSNKIKLSVTS